MKNISTENYLSEIYKLEQSKIKVKTNIIAKKLDISNAAVTDMLKKLSSNGLILYERYKNIQLTKKGKDYAAVIVRRHRIWEIFLNQIVGLPWDKVHDEAHRLEHSSSDELIDRIEEMLNYPEFDPHGDPIPAKDGSIPKLKESTNLSKVKIGEWGKVIRVNDYDNEFLNYLSRIGLKLGKKITVKDKLNFDNSLLIKIGDKQINISGKLASNIFIDLN
ncbi:MAG: metal-dependent transcriptional regulator [Bacteroidetes bacterium]|nr:metal-dependent transcriptional regulator [Bacteroidota bacterium]